MHTNFIHWSFDPEIANIMGFSLRYYGLLFAGGIVLCLTLLKVFFKKENIAAENLDTLTIYGVIGILVGARLGHCLLYDPRYYFSHPFEMILPIEILESGQINFIGYQGLASHGGAVGLLLALVLYSRKTKQSVINTVDLIGVVAPLGGCFIRLGNLMNSEIIGLPTNVPWAFVFNRVDNLPRHPAQLYEAIAYFIIFVLLLYLYQTKHQVLKNGFFFGACIFLIFVARFFIEFIKERQVSFEEEMLIDMGQLLSIPFILLGLVFIIYGLYKRRNQTPIQKLN